MIITRLQGGLGNQLFQYAAGHALAQKHQTNLKVDFSGHTGDIARSYKLSFFNINTEFATPEEVANFNKWYNRGWLAKFTNRLPFRLNRHHFKEPHFHFTPELFGLSDNVYIEGYWQTEKYFSSIEDTIRQEVVLKKAYAVQNEELFSLIRNNDSVSLHVRRGDYVANATTLKMHGVCTPEYYRRAIDAIKEKISKPYFFVFSDDPEWVKSNFTFTDPYRIVSAEGYADYQELSIMSRCKHNIVANSSFSWWGAWLGNNSDKIVIAPRQWFSGFKGDTKDLLPQRWLKL